MLDWITKLDGNGYESENVKWTPYNMNMYSDYSVVYAVEMITVISCDNSSYEWPWLLLLFLCLEIVFEDLLNCPLKITSALYWVLLAKKSGRCLHWNKYFNNCESNDASSLRGWIIQDVKALMIICKYDSKWKTMRELKIQSSVRIFVGPKSDHWLPLSPTHSLYD